MNKLICNNIKSFITIIFFIFPTILLSNERIDLDYKYTTEDPLEFYSLSNHVSSLKTVILGGETYTIKRSPNEVFIDTYYDTKELDLYKNGESIRFRKRYIKSKISKKLVQYKVLSSQVDNAMVEYKLNLKKKDIIKNEDDLLVFLSKDDNKDKQLVRKFKNKYDFLTLEKSTVLFQNRDRFYLYNQEDVHMFTVTFDDVYFNNPPYSNPFWVIEFEINEKVMGSSNYESRNNLILLLTELVDKLETSVQGMYEVKLSTYQTVIQMIKQDIKVDDNNNYWNIPILIFSLLVIIGMLFLSRKATY